ncbi:acetolactate synthase-1/2/3 large subunit [Stella humosa]|uniref:Acetolactate synthase-1/2/3 large subunit n=1 Tax=Stella humosa TaxID=94 RepID=A0A3N1LLM9_9PROT|nr:thiamine pyrophosphate-binding protein [Stella humosa]ROP91326.1 acetolactate synthase-1/2/3 large subunit [Stella humosa]BBK34317.1 acetolactate synthase [Stella humosa]
MPRNRAADLLARRLHEAGCRLAFGMPGGEVLTIVDALEAAGIRFVLARHENAAGFMAEGAWHMTGAPGILVATVGPGAANAVNVAANADQDRVPLIVLTGCVDADEALTYTHQVFDHRAVFQPVTRATFTLTAAGAGLIADKAVAIATADRPGPVHIDVPISVADTVVAEPLVSRHRPAAPAAPAEGEALETARRWLADARRPVMIAGLDVPNQGADADLRAFAEAHGVPVITTYKAKGVIPEDHPLALGGAGLSPLADTILLPLVRAADLVLLVGYDPIEMRVGWRDPWDPDRQRVVEFAAAANRHYMHHATIGFVCDVGEGLKALGRGVAADPVKWADGQATQARRRHHEAFASNGAWGPAAIVETVRRIFPRDTVATVDSGAHRILMSQLWETYAPRGVLQSSGLCTMGCALPLAIGAQIADPARPVVAFTGDAGLLMVLGELSTLADLALPVTVVVFVDACLSLIEMKQRSRQLPAAGVDFVGHDFAAIARAMGGAGETVRDMAGLEAALLAARARTDRFTVIGAVIDRQAYDGRI